MHPAGPGEEEAARLYDGHLNRWFLDPVLRGSYPEDLLEHYARRVGPIDAIRDGDLEVIARPIAFLGVNYYFPSRVRADSEDEPLGVALEPGPPPLTAMGWEVEPDGLYDLLVRLDRDYGVPIAITENGAAFDDPPRAQRHRRGSRSAWPISTAISTPSPVRSPTASTSAATSRGR